MDAWFIYADLLSGYTVCCKSTGFRTEDNDVFSVYFNIFSTSLIHVDKTSDSKTKNVHVLYV